MKILLYIVAAICGYLVSGINPAIVVSKAVYKKDIRTCGSGNPGFTNFRRNFGGKWAWWVLIFDLTKAAIVVGVFAWLFSRYVGDFQFGAAYTGVFCVLGHSFPLQYKFKGGKGFLVCLSTVFFIDWRVGLICTLLMCTLVLTTKYMSFSTVAAMLVAPVLLLLFKASVPAVCLCAGTVLFVAFRHRENFKRILNGTEAKFLLKSKKHSTKS